MFNQILYKKLMATGIGEYLDKLKSNKAQISRQTGISTSRINTLCNHPESKPYAEEFYKIILTAINNAGLDENNFNTAIQEIYPTLLKVNLLEEYEDLSPEARFFKKYTLQQKDIETKLNIPPGKISKYYSDKNKRTLATELITFAFGMNLNILVSFKEIYGDLPL